VFFEPHNPLLFSNAFFWVCLGAFRKRSNVVRLRGLPFSASEADIADFFKGLEKGPDGVVVCVNFQGRSTGQAYVQFATAELANKALDRNRWESHIISLNFVGFESLSVLLQALLKKLH
jgi:RNA recognition motif-containing protein